MNCIIPARRGSKGIPGKNFRPMCDKPLIYWTLEAAMKSKCFENIIVTSDDLALLDYCSKFQTIELHVRTPHQASDDVTMVQTVHEVIEHYPSQSYALLQPTSPLRSCKHIIEAMKQYKRSAKKCLVSMFVTSIRPSLYYVESDRGGIVQLFSNCNTKEQRQHSPKVLKENGAIYIFDHDFFISKEQFFDETSEVFLMDSNLSIDIDNLWEFENAQKLLFEQLQNESRF